VLVLTQAQLLKRYREKLENARRTSSPSASVLPNRSCRKPNQRTPSGVWTRNRGEKGSLGIGMEEVTRTGNRRSGRRRRRRGPARTHTPAAQPAAGEVGWRLLPRAHSLALEFNSPDLRFGTHPTHVYLPLLLGVYVLDLKLNPNVLEAPWIFRRGQKNQAPAKLQVREYTRRVLVLKPP
jgi:hypothetical protein